MHFLHNMKNLIHITALFIEKQCNIYLVHVEYNVYLLCD